jgi:hypothetical protein
VVAAAPVTLAVLLGDLIILGTARVGALQVLPDTVMHFFPGALTYRPADHPAMWKSWKAAPLSDWLRWSLLWV